MVLRWRDGAGWRHWMSGPSGVLQAVMASDFALPRFRYLQKLLLVHGHWCYSRLANMILYFFYKNAVRRSWLCLYFMQTPDQSTDTEVMCSHPSVPPPHVNSSWLSLFPADVCGAHLLVSVLLWILRFGHDWPVVSYLLQPDVLCLPTTHHWHAGQGRVGRDSPATTSALCERPELRGPICLFICSSDLFLRSETYSVSLQSFQPNLTAFICRWVLLNWGLRDCWVAVTSHHICVLMKAKRCAWKLQRKSSMWNIINHYYVFANNEMLYKPFSQQL